MNTARRSPTRTYRSSPLIVRRATEIPELWTRRRASRCADCGTFGERTGHMGCQYPQDRP